jgi:chromosome segregation ATPase
VYDDYTIQNEHVLKLYGVLKECSGKDFNRQKLMSVVQDSRKAMDSFKGWSTTANNLVKKNIKLQKSIADKFGNEEQNKKLNRLVTESNKYLKECKDLNDKLNDLRIKNQVHKKEMEDLNRQMEDLNRQIEDLQVRKSNLENSFSYRLGHILVKAVKKPGKNTLMAPIRLIKLIFSSIFSK